MDTVLTPAVAVDEKVTDRKGDVQSYKVHVRRK